MTRIADDEVRYVADLARLELAEPELSAMARDLDRILEYVALLEELDTEDIVPTSHAIPLGTPLRPDRAAEPIPPELALGNAPARAGDAFLVPKVIDGEEEG